MPAPWLVAAGTHTAGVGMIIFFLYHYFLHITCFFFFQIGEPVIVVDWSVYSGYGAKVSYHSDCGHVTSLVGHEVANFISRLETIGFYRYE